MPAVALTDHGRSRARSSSTARPESTESSRSSAARCTSATTAGPQDEGLCPPDPPGRVERGLRQPHQARLGRLPRGLLLQAARRLGPAERALQGAHRTLRLPLRTRLQGARERQPQGSRVRARAPARHLRRRADLHRDPGRRASRSRRASTRRSRSIAQTGLPARRNRRRPLPPPRGRAVARGASLHPVRRLAREPEPLEVRHRPVLFEVAGGDGADFADYPEALRNTLSRSPSAAP